MDAGVYACPRCGALIDPERGLCDRCGALVRREGSGVAQVGQTCFECGFSSEEPADRCPKCGEALDAECEACGALTDVRDRFCRSCKADRHAAFHDARSRAWEGDRHAATGPPSYPLFRYSFPLVVSAVFLAGAFWQLYRTGTWDLGYLAAAAAVFGVLLAFFLSSFARGRKERTALPPPSRRRGGRVEIYRTLNLGRAEHLLSVLNAEGIPALISNRHTATLEPMSLLDGIGVLVPEDRETEAREVMRAFAFHDEGEGS